MEAKLQKFLGLFAAAGPLVIKFVPGTAGFVVGGILSAIGGLGLLYHPVPTVAGSLPR